MITVYHLGTCSTCKTILKQLPQRKDYVFREIKSEPLTAGEADQLAALAGAYMPLLNKRSLQFQERGIAAASVKENEVRDLLLTHYAFLKRPVVVWDKRIWIGSDKKTVANLINALGQ